MKDSEIIYQQINQTLFAKSIARAITIAEEAVICSGRKMGIA